MGLLLEKINSFVPFPNVKEDDKTHSSLRVRFHICVFCSHWTLTKPTNKWKHIYITYQTETCKHALFFFQKKKNSHDYIWLYLIEKNFWSKHLGTVGKKSSYHYQILSICHSSQLYVCENFYSDFIIKYKS